MKLNHKIRLKNLMINKFKGRKLIYLLIKFADKFKIDKVIGAL